MKGILVLLSLLVSFHLATAQQSSDKLWKSLASKEYDEVNAWIGQDTDLSHTLSELTQVYGADTVLSAFSEAMNELMNTSLANTEKGTRALIQFASHQQDTVYMVKAYVLLAGTLSEFGDNHQALTLCYQALDLVTILGDKELNLQLQNNIGALHQNMGDIDQAIIFYSRFVHQALEMNDPVEIAKGYLNLATPYMSTPTYDTAEYYLNKALGLGRKHNLPIVIAYSLGNLAYTYVERGAYTKAIQYQSEGLEMERKMNDNLAMIDSHGVLASCYVKLGNGEKALYHFNQAYKLAHEINAKIKLLGALGIGQEVMAAMGDYPKAFELAQQYQVLNDSLLNIQKNEQFAELREKYEAAEKESQIVSLEEQKRIANLEIEKQEQENLILIIAAILSLIIASLVLFFLIQIRKSKKEVEQRNLMITNINKALNKSQDALIESNKTKDKFFALIAHDLRGPVTSMQGIGRMLAYYNKKGDENRINELISQVDQSAQSVNHLLDNLLKWALAQTDGLNYQPAIFSIKRLVDECTLIFDENLKAKQLTLSCQLDHDMAVTGDYNMISTVLRNLLSNAIKFSPESSHISVEAKGTNNLLTLSVSDSGAGMPKETIERLFNNETLASTRGTQDEKGTGLGLTLCREFVKRHHSELTISTSSKGTTIAFDLPLAKQMAEA